MAMLDQANMAHFGQQQPTQVYKDVWEKPGILVTGRRYGGYLVHLSMAMLSIGIIGIEVFQTETQGTLSQGEQLSLAGYTITYNSLDVFDMPDGRNVARAVVSVEKDGKFIGELYPRRDFFYDSRQPTTIPAVRSTLEDDLYVLLVDWEEISTSDSTFKIYHNPLVKWMWLGSWTFILGTLIAAWPEKKKEPLPPKRAAKSGKRRRA